MVRRYKRATAALDAAARERLWRVDFSSSSESGELPELAELVDSFYDEEEGGRMRAERGLRSEGKGGYRETVKGLVAGLDGDPVVARVRVVVEEEMRVSDSGGAEFRRKVASRLRDMGFDAGLCMARWDKSDGVPAGDHEYVDVINSSQVRYIVEVDVAGEFEIARPTAKYLSLLGTLPEVFVGSPDTLRSVVQVLCAAAKESMQSAGMHLPPWRRGEYMQAKWFSSYRRTTDEISSVVEHTGDEMRRATGFAGLNLCRMEIASRG